jgi:hypothetical protein
MRFSEFMDWFNSTNVALEGRPPDLKLWRELRARLDAVTSEVASSPGVTTTGPAVTAPPPSSLAAVPECVSQHHKYVGHCPYCHATLPSIETLVSDIARAGQNEIDPEPGDFRALSQEKDGGLAAEVVDTLRRRA